MSGIILYLLIGLVLALGLDIASGVYKNHPSWVNVPEWNWGARTVFILFWPLGVGLFIVTLYKEFTKNK